MQVAFPEPETIASAKVTQFDTITQRPFLRDTFGEGIPRADIDAGLYTAFYVVYPPRISTTTGQRRGRTPTPPLRCV